MRLYLLRHGRMSFPNPHADHMIAIRKGKYSLDQVLQHYEELKQECLRAQSRSPLAEEVDLRQVNSILANVYQSHWSSV